MLRFDNAWRFDPPAEVPQGVIREFFALIGRLAGQDDRKAILEHFKAFFANAAGFTSYYSSNVSWAESDLDDYMGKAASNAPLFIEAFYDACTALQEQGLAVPDINRMNRILYENDAGYEIRPPNLIAHNPSAPIEVTPRVPSLDQQARELVQESLKASERAVADGNGRQAVQEILWLLETVSTAFRGLETPDGNTIQGKYFNKIVDDLRRSHKGTRFEQVLTWITALHGYLSSPTGGGVRHGADLKLGIAMQPNEARLFCNLIRSYISYLMAEHERLSKS